MMVPSGSDFTVGCIFVVAILLIIGALCGIGLYAVVAWLCG